MNRNEIPNSEPILLVEDDSVDVMAVQRAFKELNVSNELVRAADGEEGLAYLRGHNGPMPCAILLDLNMPRMNGIEFLQVLRTDETLKDIPVVVVTTSPEGPDMARSFELGAVAYIVKSSNYREFREKMAEVRPCFTAVWPAEVEKQEPMPR
jgi:CheY-like chemotaxis protein